MSFGFLVINVCNHGEHYETPCIFWEELQSTNVLHLNFSLIWPVSGMHCADDVKDVKTRMLQRKQQDRQCVYIT